MNDSADIVFYIDTSLILPGKKDELQRALKDLVDFVNENEARPLSYNFYFNKDETEMTVVQVHPDSASLEFHMQVAGSAFPKFKELVQFKRIEIYGKPSEKLVELLYHKTKTLGSGTVEIHKQQAGFTRFEMEKIV